MTAAASLALPPEAVRCIRANPDDDQPRLLAADWCDEHGEPERAELIRVQIELAHCRDGIESCPPDARCGRCYGCVRRDRERELLDDISFPGPTPNWQYVRIGMPTEYANVGGRHQARHSWEWGWCTVGKAIYAAPIRGFIEQVECAAADWLAHGDALHAREPVREVTLTTRPQFDRQRLDSGWIRFRLPGREQEYVDHRNLDSDLPLMLDHVCRHFWPGVAFKLPEIPLALRGRPRFLPGPAAEGQPTFTIVDEVAPVEPGPDEAKAAPDRRRNSRRPDWLDGRPSRRPPRR